MDASIKDLRYGFRTLIRRPIVTGVAILSIALGVGANGAVFSLVNGLLLRPPRGVEAPDELVRVYQLRKSFDWPLGVSVPDFRDLREATGELVSSIGGHSYDFFGLVLDGAPPRRWPAPWWSATTSRPWERGRRSGGCSAAPRTTRMTP